MALRNAVAVAHRSPHRGRRIGQRDEIEALALVPQEEGVRSLPDEARTDQPDAQTRPARTHRPSLERCNSAHYDNPRERSMHVQSRCETGMIAAMRVVDGVKDRIAGLEARYSWVAIVMAVQRKYREERAGYLAATVAYYAFLSIFPLMLVFVTLLGYALEGDAERQRRLLDSALADFPVLGPQLQSNVHPLQGNGLALVIGIGIALWAGTGVCLALEYAFDRIWGIPSKRRSNYVMARLRALAWIAVLGVVDARRRGDRRAECLDGVLRRPRPDRSARRVARAQRHGLHHGVSRAHEREPDRTRGSARRAHRRLRLGGPADASAATTSPISCATPPTPTAPSRS